VNVGERREGKQEHRKKRKKQFMRSQGGGHMDIWDSGQINPKETPSEREIGGEV